MRGNSVLVKQRARSRAADKKKSAGAKGGGREQIICTHDPRHPRAMSKRAPLLPLLRSLRRSPPAAMEGEVVRQRLEGRSAAAAAAAIVRRDDHRRRRHDDVVRMQRRMRRPPSSTSSSSSIRFAEIDRRHRGDVVVARRRSFDATTVATCRFSSASSYYSWSDTTTSTAAAMAAREAMIARACHRRRRYLVEEVSTSTGYRTSAPRLSYSSYSSDDDDDYDDDIDYPHDERGSGSLHSAMHRILRAIPVGRMTESDISRARSFMSISSRWQNARGASLCENLLERLYAEGTSGGNANVVVDASMYNEAMMAWSGRCVDDHADGTNIANRASSIMKRMEDMKKQFQEVQEDIKF